MSKKMIEQKGNGKESEREEQSVSQRLLQLALVDRKPACKESVLNFGESLVSSFGLDEQNTQEHPDSERGYVHAANFLQKVCGTFKDPTHLIEIAPFAHTYLGERDFNQALEVVLQRARAHPDEQAILDEVFTATALLSPEQRGAFLASVVQAEVIESGIMGLEGLVAQANPQLSFSSAGELPREFHTADVRKAAELLGLFLELGMFKP